MSDAFAEVIWAHEPTTFDDMDVWTLTETGGAVEYIRLDIPKARIKELEAENERLREAMVKACNLIDDIYDKKPGANMATVYRKIAAALQETERTRR